MKKALIIGKIGQVGFELRRSLQAVLDTQAVDYPDIDLTNPQRALEKIKTFDFDVLINAAAYNAVDKAEQEPEVALAVNGESPLLLAKWCADNRKLFLSYSTDFVFDGSKTSPYSENDPQSPLSIYARSKAIGENSVLECKAGIMLRVSWVYSYRGSNFLQKILELAKSKSELSIVDDQIGSPTPARYIADVTRGIICKLNNYKYEDMLKFSGVYNIATSGYVSRLDFAQKAFELIDDKSGFMCTKMTGVKSSAYPTPAKRPLNSRLLTSKAEDVFQVHSPSWQQCLELTLEEMGLRKS